jgi:hypothetical protein
MVPAFAFRPARHALAGHAYAQHLLLCLACFLLIFVLSPHILVAAGVEGIGTEESALALYEDAEGDRGVLADQVCMVWAACCFTATRLGPLQVICTF